MDKLQLWRRYQETSCDVPGLGMSLDISRMDFDEGFFDRMEPAIQKAYAQMKRLEAGEIVNPDEGRMVGHYWLRAPFLAPNDGLIHEIEQTLRDIDAFAAAVHSKQVAPPTSAKFTDVVVIGIGGSALGPQLVSDCLSSRKDKMQVSFMDNTDPDGFDRVIESLGSRLKSTLVVVISKSGGTKETRNGMLYIEAAYKKKGLDFAKHAVAVTGVGSDLDKHAINQGWIKRFPMWDWVGGRTSIMSAVGLVPMALQGIDIHAFLNGAAEMDKVTREPNTKTNPSARLALMWHLGTGGKGLKDMVMLPYKDRLLLMSRYLQQLLMESLGKDKDLDGNPTAQGIAVYGNKGSTDQHAYVQQLRDGVNNFFVTFIVVLQDRQPQVLKQHFEVEPGATSGDYLSGFWQGTREALYDKGRHSITITIDKLDTTALGALIGMYERAVGFYATLVNINAYHQPGVEAGKKAAAGVLDIQRKVVEHLKAANADPATAAQIADKMGRPQDAETIHHVLTHLVANKRGVAKTGQKFRLKA